MGATGAMLMSNLVCELERRSAKFGLLTMCESGGTANATIIERVDSAARPSDAPSDALTHMSMGRALRAVAAWKGSAPAVTAVGADGVVTSLSFQQLEDASNRLARV